MVVPLLWNILLSWAFETSLNCSVMCKPAWWFECYFRRFFWIHCWLLLAVLSDYFGHLISSTFLLCKFQGLPLIVFPLWGVECVLEWRDSLSQVAQLPREGLRKHGWNGSRRDASNAESSKLLFHFKPEKVNKFEYRNNLCKQDISHNPVLKLKACLSNNEHAVRRTDVYANLLVNLSLREGTYCYKSLPKHKTVIEDLDNIIQDFKTVR